MGESNTKAPVKDGKEEVHVHVCEGERKQKKWKEQKTDVETVEFWGLVGHFVGHLKDNKRADCQRIDTLTA